MTYSQPEQLRESARKTLEELLKRSESLKPKERMKIPPQEMPSQEPEIRRGNVNEVALGYFPEQAWLEAMRCLQCKNAPCVGGCPVRIDIPAFVTAVAEGDFKKAIDIVKKDNLLPAICGRVCPQEVQCQAECTLGKALKDVGKAVSIGRLERFVSDWERENNKIEVPSIAPETGKKVAIIGSGPAGLTVAADLRRAGHAVTIFEALHKPGGVMVYGIPEFRLPKALVSKDIETVLAMGVELKTNFVVGRTRKLMDLLSKGSYGQHDGFDMAFVGSGAGLPKFMRIEGENLVGVFSANEYLTRANLMRAYEIGRADTPIVRSRKVAVLGGGNVAMDSARMALRLGVEESHIVYRRTEKEMPARIEEVEHAREEGVIFHLLQNAIRFIGDDHGRLKAMECLRYELGEPDESGRRRPVPIKGSEFFMEVDTVIVAIGNDPNPLIPRTTQALSVAKWGGLIVDEKGKTSLDEVYAGGDIVRGSATVILAMGDGRKAAVAINERLAGD